MRISEQEYRRLTGAGRGLPSALPQERSRSSAERELEERLAAAGIDGWEVEYEFHPERKWRLDFAWPAERLAVEVEGAVHRIKDKYGRDLDKYNALTLRGWRLLRFDRRRILSGKAVETIRGALDGP